MTRSADTFPSSWRNRRANSSGLRQEPSAVRLSAKGAETAVYLCSSPEVEGVTGDYFYDCKRHEPRDFARNDEDARRLWEISERMTSTQPR